MAQPATSSPIDASAAARGARFEALGARAAVSIRRSACLRLRLASATCGACAAVCPTQALRAGEQQFELSGNCTGCGRCQTVCPSSALAVEGFDDAPVTATAGALTIECWRTPAGSGTHPARAVVERAAAWLAEAGVPAALRPAFVAPAAAGPAPAPAPAAMDPMQQQGRARRGFFAALAQPARAPQPSACLPAHSEASSQRQQGLAALQALVARHGGRMPAALVHRLQAGSSCQGHRVCAAACPTGALVRWRDDAHQRMGIAFDNAHCIACGHCVEVCPEQALQLQLGGGAAGAGRRALSTFEQRACPGCGTRFASRAEEEHTHCPRCRKSAGLARSAFQTLFGART